MIAASGSRTRQITWEDPRRSFEAGSTMSGLEYLRALRDGVLPMPPIMALIGAGVSELEEGRTVLYLDPAEFHYNALGVVHGGVAATLCDTAMGCAVQSTLPRGTGFATLELKVNYIRPLTDETGRVTCEGKVLHRGTRTAVAEARLADAGGRIHAHATCTCVLLRR